MEPDYEMPLTSCRELTPDNRNCQQSLYVYEQREAEREEINVRPTGVVEGCRVD